MTDKELLEAALHFHIAPNLNKLSQVLGYTQPSTLYTVMKRDGNLSQSKRLRLKELIGEKKAESVDVNPAMSLQEIKFALRLAKVMRHSGLNQVAQAIVNAYPLA